MFSCKQFVNTILIVTCVYLTGSSGAQPKESVKEAPPKEPPSKSSGSSSSKGPDKKFEFSFNLAKYVHYAVVSAHFL